MRKFIRHPSDIPIEVCHSKVNTSSTENLLNVSLGGLSFQSQTAQTPGKIINIRIPLFDPPFETSGQVMWCSPREGIYDIGVKLLDVVDAYHTRMVEQACHIEHYKRQVLVEEGRALTGQQAAMEWIHKYAGTFPNIHEVEAI